MKKRLIILSLVAFSLFDFSAAQLPFTAEKNNLPQNQLAICQAVHLIPLTFSRINDAAPEGANAIYDAETAQLYQQIETLEDLIDPSVGQTSEMEFVKAVLANTLTNIRFHRESAFKDLPTFAKRLPNDLGQALSLLSDQSACDKIEIESQLPGIDVANKGISSSSSGTTGKDQPLEALESPAYSFIPAQSISSDTATKQLATRPVTLLLERDKRYAILIALIILIAGSVYFYHRRKNFKSREPRRILNLTIRARFKDKVRILSLVDLSRNGAKLEHKHLNLSKGNVEVHLGNQWHLGQIVWSNDLYAGIKFRTPLDAHTFEEVTNL